MGVTPSGPAPRGAAPHPPPAALGAARGAAGEVRVAPRGGRRLHALPAPHVGLRAPAARHGGAVPAAPLAPPVAPPPAPPPQ